MGGAQTRKVGLERIGWDDRRRLAASLGAPAVPAVRRTALAPGVDHTLLFRALPTMIR